MAAPEHYHTISVGSGETRKYVCWNLSSTLGYKTAVIEHKWLGGSCPNIACLPSKNVLFSADVVHNAQSFLSSGLIKVNGDANAKVDVDMKVSGAELIMGHGRLVGEKKIEVELRDGGKRVLTAENIIICTGSRARIEDIPGLKESKPLTHVEVLELDEVPQHLVVLGGGYVGIEFAQAFRRLGAEVSIVERGERILKNEDEDVSTVLSEILTDEGIKIYTSASITAVSGTSGESITLTGTSKANQHPFSLTGTHLLCATGCLPNSSVAGLETLNIQLTPTDHIKVNAHLQTKIPHIFAVGDCTNSPHFTHIGYDDFRIVRAFIAKDRPLRSTTTRQIPYTLYTDPELAHIGHTETSAQTAGIPYRVAKIPMAAFLRTRTMGSGATKGFAKALVVTDDEILGFTALGPRAGELLPVMQLAMAAKLGHGRIAELIVVHPTMGEGLVALFGSVEAK